MIDSENMAMVNNALTAIRWLGYLAAAAVVGYILFLLALLAYGGFNELMNSLRKKSDQRELEKHKKRLREIGY